MKEKIEKALIWHLMKSKSECKSVMNTKFDLIATLYIVHGRYTNIYYQIMWDHTETRIFV